MSWFSWKTRLAKLDGARADITMENAVGAGCSKVKTARVDSAGINGTRRGNRIRDDYGPGIIESVKVDIVTSKFKTLILISS